MPLEKDKSGGFKFSIRDEINTGLWPTAFSRRAPLWSTGSNVQFTEYGVEKIQGNEELADTATSDPVRGMCQTVTSSGSGYVFFGTLTKLFRYDVINDTLTDVSGSTYTGVEDGGSTEWDGGTTTWDSGTTLWDSGLIKASQWSLVPYGDWVLATNGEDTPQIYKGTTFANLTGLGTVGTIQIFVRRGPHILGFNTDISKREFIWCDADNPEDWVASSTNLAGQLEIREMNGEIVSAVPLGNSVAVYSADQMFLVNYLANDLVFGYSPAVDGIGSVSRYSIVPVGRFNYGLSSQGFFQTDGTSFQYIDDPAIRHWYKNNVTQNQLNKTIGFHDEENNQIRWYLPVNSATNDKCLSYNYVQKVWSFIDIGDRTAGIPREIMTGPVVGDSTGKIYLENSTSNNNGSAITATIQTKSMDLGDADRVKELDTIRVGYTGSGLEFRVGWSDTEDGTITWGDYISVDNAFGFNNVRTAGRWLHLGFRSTMSSVDWEMVSIEVIGRSEGTR